MVVTARLPRRTTYDNYPNNSARLSSGQWSRRSGDALFIVASIPAIGKRSVVWVASIRVAVRWRGASHVTIDKEQRKMAVRGEGSD